MKPTPTQEEMDAFHRGERKASHEPDGSPEQHIGAQGQIENVHMVKYNKKMRDEKEAADKKQAAEHKKAEQAKPRAMEAEKPGTYTTRTVGAKKDEKEN